MNKKFILDILKKYANKSIVQKSKHSACFVINNRIVSVGYNKYLNHRSKFKKYTIHAEVDAWMKLHRKYRRHKGLQQYCISL